MNDEFETEPHDFQKQLTAARAGDQEARNQLFASLQKYLSFIARQNRNERLSAKIGISDIVQQTLLNAASAFPTFRGESPEEFRGWVRQILIHETHNLNRHFETQRRNAAQEIELSGGRENPRVLEIADCLSTPSREMLSSEENARIRQLLDQLPEDLRRVIHLRNWEQLSFREIAEKLQVTVSQAAKLWYRALVELQQLYADQSRP